ncbi:hypothetical protein DFJ73DRAFT_565454 [Zopfochytrium polystomum]|nr:hypothetical protein DFJ73DRAFT_565454 [Zopfochytrium polystomum]
MWGVSGKECSVRAQGRGAVGKGGKGRKGKGRNKPIRPITWAPWLVGWGWGVEGKKQKGDGGKINTKRARGRGETARRKGFQNGRKKGKAQTKSNTDTEERTAMEGRIEKGKEEPGKETRLGTKRNLNTAPHTYARTNERAHTHATHSNTKKRKKESTTIRQKRNPNRTDSSHQSEIDTRKQRQRKDTQVPKRLVTVLRKR